MADYALPTLTSNYSDMLTVLKDRDINSMKMFDGTTDSNLPVGTKKWNSTNNYFEKFDGSSWSPLTAKYMINVDLLDGCTVNDTGISSNDLWTASKVLSQIGTKLDSTSYTANDVLTKIKTVDGVGSGLDADLLDGMNSASTNSANTIVARDASGNFSAGTITASIAGNASTATNVAWSGVTAKPTTLSGYGIIDGATSTHTHNYAGSASAGGPANSVAWSGVTAKPTTLSGYGITDGAASTHTHNYAGSASVGGPATTALDVSRTLVASGVMIGSYGHGGIYILRTGYDIGNTWKEAPRNKYVLSLGISEGGVSAYPFRSMLQYYPAQVVGMNNGTASTYAEGELNYTILPYTLEGSGTINKIMWELHRVGA